MRVELPEQLEVYIQEKVKAGLYSNSAEVIRDALRHMMEKDEHAERERRLLAALQVGADQLERGEGREWNESLREELKQNALKKAQLGRRPKADVVA